MIATAEMISEGSSHIRPQRETGDPIERLAFSRQRKCLHGLSAVATRDEKINTNIKALALERPDDGASKLPHGDRIKTASKRFYANMFVLAPREKVKRQPIHGRKNVPNQSRRLRCGLAGNSVTCVGAGE